MKKNTTPKTYEELETIASQLLTVMNNKNFNASVIGAARNQLNSICYAMWNTNDDLEFVTWMQNDIKKYVLLYTWKTQNNDS